MSIVRLENVSKHYTLGEQQVQALKDVSLGYSRWRVPCHRRPIR